MKRVAYLRFAVVILSLATVAASSRRSEALTAASADDICAPATDPCVISQSYDVTGPLDFGTRSVRIISGGRLKGQPGLTLAVGALEITSGLTADPVIEIGGGQLIVTAKRACLGDPLTPCLDDTVCAAADLGTCTAGNTGTIAADGKISGSGGYHPGSASLIAAGDITLGRAVNFSSTAAGYNGGSVDVRSYMGSLVVNGQIRARSGVGTDSYSAGGGGEIDLRAAVDVNIAGGVDVWGAGWGGSAYVQAGRDLVVSSGISGSGGGGTGANGGSIGLYAGRDIILVQVPGGDALQEIQTDGGTSFYFYGYGNGGGWYSGYGGEQFFYAGEDISLGPSAKVHSNGGWAASGGSLYFGAQGRLTIEGEVRAVGLPPNQGADSGAGGGHVFITTAEGMTLAQGGLIKTASPVHGGSIWIEANGPVALNGEIDVRGNGAQTYGGENYSQSGYFSLEGAADVVVGGKIRAGGPYRSGYFKIDACRLALASTGVIDDSHGSPNPHNNDTLITVRESMTAASFSKLLADTAGARNVIVYRDPKKPPVLDGTVIPPPVVAVDPSLAGCPVCGNLEIDQGESCDDGNTTNGDGCRIDCQDEGCIAQTPGYPTTPLCDDGNACTLNDCDPVAHACSNPVSCDEGVACTVDACAGGPCTHSPDDSRCDDRNDCTEDLCNATTGCVHADRTGSTCHDSDPCTAAGTCDDGDCLTTASRLATAGQMKIKVATGAANDMLKASMSLPLALLSTDPTSSGARLVLADSFGDILWQGELPAAGWSDKTGTGVQFTYNDGARAAKVKRVATDGVARASLKIKDAELAGAAGARELSVSILFGADPTTDDCLTALHLACTAKGASVSCRE